MDEGYFSLFDKKIILYGAASIGILSKRYFERGGFCIEGFIDQRNDELDEFLGKPVWGINDRILTEKKTDGYVVYISVKNVFEHSKIANRLAAHGFHNIIYRPLAAVNGCGDEKQNTLYAVYDHIERGEFHKISQIPKTIAADRVIAKNSGFLEEVDESVVCLVSICMLHTDKKIRKTPWFDKPVLAELPHIDFFRYISGEPGYTCDRYMKFCEDSAAMSNKIAMTEGWRRNVIRNRASVYSHMSESMEVNQLFFQKNAAKAAWNPAEGVFNLNSGKHRAAFFASKKRKYIPLRMSKKDYEQFINEKEAVRVGLFFQKMGITEIDFPIPHPFYYEYPCENREFYYNFLYWLMYEIAVDLYDTEGELKFDKLRIYSSLHDFGFIERCLIKADCKMYIQSDDNEQRILYLLDRLCHSNLCNNLKEQDVKEWYDYLLLDIRNMDDTIKFICSMNFKKCFVIVEETDKFKFLSCERLICKDAGFQSIRFGKKTCVIQVQCLEVNSQR